MKLTTSPRLLAFSLFLVSPAAPVVAQDSPVRAVSEEVHNYLSPMVLELDLSEFLELPADQMRTTRATRLFACRLVTIESISISVSSPSDNPRRVAVQLLIRNSSGKDKSVEITIANGERGREQKMLTLVQKVVPDETKLSQGTLLLSPNDAWVHQPRPVVRLTVTPVDY